MKLMPTKYVRPFVKSKKDRCVQSRGVPVTSGDGRRSKRPWWRRQRSRVSRGVQAGKSVCFKHS